MGQTESYTWPHAPNPNHNHNPNHNPNPNPNPYPNPRPSQYAGWDRQSRALGRVALTLTLIFLCWRVQYNLIHTAEPIFMCAQKVSAQVCTKTQVLTQVCTKTQVLAQISFCTSLTDNLTQQTPIIMIIMSLTISSNTHSRANLSHCTKTQDLAQVCTKTQDLAQVRTKTQVLAQVCMETQVYII